MWFYNIQFSTKLIFYTKLVHTWGTSSCALTVWITGWCSFHIDNIISLYYCRFLWCILNLNIHTNIQDFNFSFKTLSLMINFSLCFTFEWHSIGFSKYIFLNDLGWNSGVTMIQSSNQSSLLSIWSRHDIKTEVVTPKNDVWPRCDECDYKPGVRNNEA